MGNSIVVLNREVKWTQRGLEYKHDARHVDVLVEEFNLSRCKPISTPVASGGPRGGGEKKEDDHEDAFGDRDGKVADWAAISAYRSHVARANYIAQDRPDIGYAVCALCQEMAAPTIGALRRLKRLVRYLKGQRQWTQLFEFPDAGPGSEPIRGHCDLDWAGDQVTRRSTSAGCLMMNGTAAKHWVRKQKVISRSSAEAEL